MPNKHVLKDCLHICGNCLSRKTYHYGKKKTLYKKYEWKALRNLNNTSDLLPSDFRITSDKAKFPAGSFSVQLRDRLDFLKLGMR